MPRFTNYAITVAAADASVAGVQVRQPLSPLPRNAA